MLKSTLLSERSIFEKLKFGDNKFSKFGISGKKLDKNSGKLKNEKLSKLEKSKGKKSAKSKKQLKSWNSLNLGVIETGSSFLTSDARISFNRL